MINTAPQFALIDAREGLIIEPFSAERHLCGSGWSRPGVTLFSHPADVAHLRDLIVN
jgi:hypothetical protein